MTIADLPTDIARIIVDNVISGAIDTLDKWSAALPIMQVCHEWRSLAVPYMYSYVHIEFELNIIPKVDAIYEHMIDTNCSLICRNKLQHLVKVLYFGHANYVEDVDILYILNHFIKSGIWGSNPVVRTIHFNKGVQSMVIMALQQWAACVTTTASDDEINGLDEDVCMLLTRTFKNIISIIIEENEHPPSRSAILQDMLKCYGGQLSLLKFSSNGELINMSAACKLTDLDLEISEFHYDDLESDMHPICPDYLQNVTFRIAASVYFWKLFSWNPSSNKIVFENLRKLKLDCEHYTYDPYEEAGENYYGLNNFYLGPSGQYELVFPRLVELDISAFDMSVIELRYLLQAPLQCLTYRGSVKPFLEGYSQLPSTLKYVSLDLLYLDGYNAFIPYFNRVFKQMHGIDVVKCRCSLSKYATKLYGIDWPNLTHIYLGSHLTIEDIIVIADHSPDLVEFTFRKHGYDSEEEHTVSDAMLNMREHYTRPSSSKIHTLNLIYDKAFTDNFLNKVLENLKWYWPKLQNINIMHSRGYR